MRLRTFPDRERFREYSRRGNVIPVCTEVLADTETPVSTLARLRRHRRQAPLFLLESVEGGERWGRYSFLGATAHREVEVFRETVRVTGGGGVRDIPHNGDPLDVLRTLMKDYRPVRLPSLPRFWGGLVGYLTYEMVSFLERISLDAPGDLPLAHFVVTGDLFVFDNLRHTLTLVAHAFLDAPPGGNPDDAYEAALAKLESMRSLLDGPVGGPDREGAARGACTLEPVVEKERFTAGVSRIKNHITAGDVIQAVLSQPFTCTPAPDPWLLYRAQRYVNPSPYMFYVQLGEAVLVGSSPETMVRLENGVATLRPIAGTRPRGAGEQEDRRLADELLKDPKERAEHLMLVDLGRNDLGRVAEVGSVQVTELMTVERYSHVMHLVSNIACHLDERSDAWDLIRAAFPAGTLTGAPKVRAMEIIAEQERGDRRGPYGGAVGYIAFDGNMDLAITIRTGLVSGGRLTVRAGAGIVADSDPEKEWLETVNKAGAIQRALELLAS